MTVTFALAALVALVAALTAAISLVRAARSATRASLEAPVGHRLRPKPVTYEEEADPAGDGDMVALSSEQHAIVIALRHELEAAAREADRKSLYANLLFFVAGILASIVITLVVHPL